MVLVRRQIEARSLYVRSEPPAQIPREKILTQCAHDSMTAVLDQLGFLFAYSNELFTELVKDANKTHERIQGLNVRVQNLAQYIPGVEQYLDATPQETISANPCVEWKSQIGEEAALFTKDTNPHSIIDTYETYCIPPPNLALMDSFMEDGEPCLKKFTNPNFFIEEWLLEQKKQHEEAKKRKAKRRAERKAKPQRPQARNEKKVVQKMTVKRKKLNAMGADFAEDSKAPPVAGGGAGGTPQKARPVGVGVAATLAPSSFNAAPAADPQYKVTSSPITSAVPSSSSSSLPTPTFKPAPSITTAAAPASPARPPPPAAVAAPASIPAQAPGAPPPRPPPVRQDVPVAVSKHELPAYVPPPAATPPPPPAVPPPPASPAAAPPPPRATQASSSALLPPAEPSGGKQSALLSQIQRGMKLKTVESSAPPKEDPETSNQFNVAKILARRAAMEFSDSDDDDDDGDWD